MPIDIKTIGLCLAAPAAAALTVALVMLRAFPSDVSRRAAAGYACAAGFFAGFALLQPGNLRPSSTWHWLPWLGALAAVASSIGLASGVRLVERWTLHIAVAFVAAWCLVPARSNVQLPRDIQIAVFAGGVFLLSVLLDLAGSRSPGPSLAFHLAFAALGAGAFLAMVVSLTFAELAGACVAAFAGCGIACTIDRTNLVRGATLAYAVVIGGLQLAGSVYAPFVPKTCFIIAAAAPSALCLCEFGPLSRLRGKWAFFARALAIALPLVVALGLAEWTLRTEPH